MVLTKSGLALVGFAGSHDPHYIALVDRRTVVLADLHLSRHTPEGVSRDLVRLIGEHRGARLVFAGDLFDLSADAPTVARDRGVEEGLLRYPNLAHALSEHVDRDGELYIVSGNHDAELAAGQAANELASRLHLTGAARDRVHTTPWFLRFGRVHVEHGHLYDPDNAPAHPLVPPATSSLGVHFVEQFIAPTGAFAYLNANDGTPLKLLMSSFAWYGKRAPYVIYRFFHAATTAVLGSGTPYRAEVVRAEQHANADERATVAAFAAARGVDVALTDRVLELRAEPTLLSTRRTFARLYLDRVAAAVGTGLGLAAMGAGHVRAGALLAAASASAMTASWAAGQNRYAGRVTERLADAARRVAAASDAALVIFGHTHREAIEGVYANTGSFAFPRNAPGRPYLEIEGTEEHPVAVRRHLLG